MLLACYNRMSKLNANFLELLTLVRAAKMVGQSSYRYDVTRTEFTLLLFSTTTHHNPPPAPNHLSGPPPSERYSVISYLLRSALFRCNLCGAGGPVCAATVPRPPYAACPISGHPSSSPHQSGPHTMPTPEWTPHHARPSRLRCQRAYPTSTSHLLVNNFSNYTSVCESSKQACIGSSRAILHI